MKTLHQTKLHPRLNARLTAYTAVTGAALAATAATLPAAKADIVYSGPLSINIPSNAIGIYLNVVTGVSNTTPANAPGWDINPYGTSALTFFNPATPTGGVYVVNAAGGTSATAPDNLPFGTLVSAASGFGSGTGETTGPTAFLVSSTANYLGFRFQNEVTNQIDYGWAQLSLSTTTSSQPRSIIGYAYENTGAAISAGAVPEPTTTATLGLGALTLGAAGVRRWRKAKKQAVA